MEALPDTLPEPMSILWLLAIPLLATLLAMLIKASRLREGVLVVVAMALFIAVASLYDDVLAGNVPSVTLLSILPGMSISFSLGGFGMVFALVASSLWTITTLYASGYMDTAGEKNLRRFFIFFSFSIFATMGIAMADNLFTMFLFYEALTLSTYPLVTHKGDDNSRRSGQVYLGTLLTTSLLCFLPAMMVVYHLTGTLDFTAGGILADKASPAMITLLLVLFVFGVGKTAVMPLHRWLPAAMVAPTPVSALLHAVAVVKAGVFTLIQIVNFIFGADVLANMADGPLSGSGWLLYISSFTVLMGSIVALQQDNLKKRLAYSTVSQLSYIILALGLFSPLGTKAAVLHIAMHGVSKITLFFAAGAIYTASKKTLVSQLDGIGKRMPITMAAFGIGALSMIGIPLAAGFDSKYAMMDAAFDRGSLIVVGTLVCSTMLNAWYLLPIVIRAYFAEERIAAYKGTKKKHGEASKRQVIALSITSLLTLWLFFKPDALLELIHVGM